MNHQDTMTPGRSGGGFLIPFCGGGGGDLTGKDPDHLIEKRRSPALFRPLGALVPLW